MELRIGCAADVPLERLLAFLGALQARCVDLELNVEHAPSAPQLQRLRDGQQDLALVHGSEPGPDVEAERLYEGEALACIVSVAHRLAGCDVARLEDLAGDALVVVPPLAEPEVHAQVIGLAASGRTAFKEVREAPGADLRDLLFAVASGRGVTVAPASTLRLVGDLAEAVTALPLEPSVSMPDTFLAWPVTAPPELDGFHGAAHDVARELYRSSR